MHLYIPMNVIQGLLILLFSGCIAGGTLLYVTAVNAGDNWDGVPSGLKVTLWLGIVGCIVGVLRMSGML